MKNSIKPLVNIIKQYSWRSIFFRYFCVLLLCIGIPLSGLIWLISAHYTDNINAEIQSNASNAFARTSNNFTKALEDISKTYDMLIADGDVIAYLDSGKLTTSPLEIDYFSKVHEKASNLVYMSNYIDSIYLYHFNNNYVLSTKNGNFLENFGDISWYYAYMKDKKDYAVMLMDEKNGNKSGISVYFSVAANNDPVGLFVINMQPELLQLVSGDVSDSADFLYVFDTNFKPIAQSQNAVNFDTLNISPEKSETNTVYSDGKTMSYISEIRTHNLYLVMTTNVKNFEHLTNHSRMLFVSCIVFAIIAIVLVSFYISMKFFNMIMNIATVFTSTTDTLSPSDEEKNELEFISRNIIQLIDKNKSIENELALRMLHLKKSQIAMLQTQINPHFLFNTLNLINLYSYKENGPQNGTSKIIVLLSDILSFALNTSKYIIPIRDEIAYAQKYIEIENIKYKDSFDVSWDIDTKILNYMTPKFILQPIVENAFKHGILPLGKTKRGEVHISAYINGDVIYFEIKNNGVQIDAQKLEEINNNLKIGNIPENDSVGLFNVNSRIKLIFNDNFGCSVSSDIAETSVVIKIPILTD